MNQLVKDKFNEIVLTVLLLVQGAFKSWTMWINGVILALPQILDNVEVLRPILQDLLPENYYAKLLLWLPAINMLLRIKTASSLIAKAQKPTSVGDSLRSILPMLVLGLALLVAVPVAQAEPVRRTKDGKIYRSAAQLSVFKMLNPCPATGLTTGACAGYVIDHIWPLRCARTEAERRLFDVPENLQWQTVAAAKLKDKTEGAECRASAGAAALDGDAS
jgi:hypothetical protein